MGKPRGLLPPVLLFAAVAHGFVSLHLSFRVTSPNAGSGSILMRGPRPKTRKMEPRIERRTSPTESGEQQRARHLQLVQAAARHHAAAVADGLAQRGFALVDNFLPAETVSILRSECVSLLHGNKMYASESTRWDEESAQVVTYKKVNVMSYNLVGGTEYELAPRLTEYCVALVSSLPALINERFPEAALSARVHTNKLAVCLGEGSHYQKHYDNSGRDDRKLTVIVYLQTPQYSLEDGGCFRMFEDGDGPPPAGARGRPAARVLVGRDGARCLSILRHVGQRGDPPLGPNGLAAHRGHCEYTVRPGGRGTPLPWPPGRSCESVGWLRKSSRHQCNFSRACRASESGL